MCLLKESPEKLDEKIEQWLGELSQQEEEMNNKGSQQQSDSLWLELQLRESHFRRKRHAKELLSSTSDLLYCHVVSQFHAANVELTPRLKRNPNAMYSRLGPLDFQRLLNLHSTETLPLVKEYVQGTLCKVEPIELGNFRLRMPYMGGSVGARQSTSVPYAVIAQVYSVAVFFGYNLERARRVHSIQCSISQCLDGSEEERGHSESGPGTVESARAPLRAYVYPSDKWNAAPPRLNSKLARRICTRQTNALFGKKGKLVAQLLEAIEGAASPEDAQHRLLDAMEMGKIPWLKVSPESFQRLVLEAMAFGTFLHTAEQMYDAELGFLLRSAQHKADIHDSMK
eukprot:CAMPEP_0114224428 /NCGR_PEP_ID=MMETSP0058-20121206/102_1 /TAXON_ID=36894 /ORGANISM="Pyramimonas parkeae, CCMP726" /LENGTH=340 /DNA_ID=CAMNT_0001334903 /DNA_START=429 /DNA_END=1451 /DNA_ORIENTATION=+